VLMQTINSKKNKQKNMSTHKGVYKVCDYVKLVTCHLFVYSFFVPWVDRSHAIHVVVTGTKF